MSQSKVVADAIRDPRRSLGGTSALHVDGFFEALANADERTGDWDNLVAGLAAMRAAEAALNGDAEPFAPARVDSYVSRVLDTGLRALLRTIVAATRLGEDDSGRRYVLAGRLMAYGMQLHAMGLFAPACDVFLAIQHADLFDSQLTLQAIYQRAFALRMLQRFDAATAAYAELRTAARTCGDRRLEIEADLGDAKVAIELGNLPTAEELADGLIALCERINDRQLRGKALIDRAAIAGLRKQPDRALRYSLMALRDVQESHRRDRLCNNIAAALRDLGRNALAKETAAVVAMRGEHADQRMLAEILLYSLAVDEQAWEAAEALRRRLARATLTPQRAAEYYQVEGAHLAAIGETGKARSVLSRMLAIAQSHRLGQLAHEAEEALEALRRGASAAPREQRSTTGPERPTAPSFDDVVAVVAEAYA